MRRKERKKKIYKPRDQNYDTAAHTTDISDLVATVWKVAEPVCATDGLELIHVEYQREQSGWVLRLYMDKPGGINIDDCAHISRKLGDIFDFTINEPHPYILEVTSPGPERPLSRIKDFELMKGKSARIRTKYPIGGRKTFTGTLVGIMDGLVLHSIENETLAIPYDAIHRARLQKQHGD